MSKLREFTVSSARSLPVILLTDVSGSMNAQGKIDALNSAVAEMIASIAEDDDGQIEVQIAIITFGHGEARIHQPLQPASQVVWQNMDAKGKTPMGAAFELAFRMLEDRQQVPSRAYAPTLVLISDGQPTDEWKGPLEKLLSSERASKAARFAMAIGSDADIVMLRKFLDDSSTDVFMAHEAREIKKFFRGVTMSVTLRSRSSNPNNVEPTEFELDF